MSEASLQFENEQPPYLVNVLVAIDQLGNTLAGGNPDNTISSRVGQFASKNYSIKFKKYWIALQSVIDRTFEPLQGPGHCFDAWQEELDEKESQGSDIARGLLGIFVFLGCAVICLFLWPAVWLFPNLRYSNRVIKQKVVRYGSWRESRHRQAAHRQMTQAESHPT